MVDVDDCVYLSTMSGRSEWTSSIAGSTTSSWIPRCSGLTPLSESPDLVRAWRAGNVAIINTPGAGVADDKVIYAYVPRIIGYYLGEDPAIANILTYVCADDAERGHVLVNLDELVVKPANEWEATASSSARSTASEKDEMRCRVIADPRNCSPSPSSACRPLPR